jgi:signal transduction histidine kinase
MVLVTFVAVVAFAVPLAFAAARIFREREVSRLEREATRAEGALSAGGLQSADPVELPAHRPAVRIGLYDDRGRLVAGEGPSRGGTEVFSALTGRIEDDRDGRWLAVAVPVHDEEQIVAAARAASPWNVVTTATYRSWLAMAALGLLAVGLAAALGRWQSTRLAEPVDDVARMAVRLGDGDFGARVEATGVAELDRAADALNRTAGRLGEILGRERAFTADVSHQLNTPLTSLRLGLESALVTPGADTGAALRDAVDEVERLQTTVATLLAVARDRTTADARCDVAAVCADVADRNRARLAASGRPLRVDLDHDLPLVRCPPDVVREILAVLVDNGLRHGAGTVTITARRAGPGAVVEVGDEGEGIADPATVFLRRPPDANGAQREGPRLEGPRLERHGIGLALARSLADAHEARLQLTRAAPGPVFTLALPGSPGQEESGQEESGQEESGQEESGQEESG